MGQTFRIKYNARQYDIGVVDVTGVRGEKDAICIIESDVQVDFEAPADYVEPPRPTAPSSATPSPQMRQTIKKSGPVDVTQDSSDEEDEKPSFTGSGFRLDGKAIKANRYSTSPPSRSSSNPNTPSLTPNNPPSKMDEDEAEKGPKDPWAGLGSGNTLR